MRAPKSLMMHESAATALCRLAYLGLGLTPVLVCIAWTIVIWTPFYTANRIAAWQSTISAHTGLDAKIGRVVAESPWRTRLENISLRDPETTEPIVESASLIAQRTTDSWLLQTSTATLTQEHLSNLTHAVHDWVLCRPSQFQDKVVLAIDELRYAGSDIRLTQFRLSRFPGERVQRMHVAFLPPANATTSPQPTTPPNPIEFIVRREVIDKQFRTGLRLTTGNAQLPLSLLPPKLRLTDRFGDSATLNGRVDLVIGDEGWTATLGEKASNAYTSFLTIDNLDFTRLTHNTLCRVHGVGTLTLGAKVSNSAIWDTHGLVSINSEVNHIGGLFAQAACHYLGLEDRGTLGASTRADFPFEQLSLAFGSTGGKLFLASGGQGDTILIGRDSPLVWRSPKAWQEPIPMTRVTELLRYLEAAPELRTPFGSPIPLADRLARMLPRQGVTPTTESAERIASDQGNTSR